jgi:hypothetical protein
LPRARGGGGGGARGEADACAGGGAGDARVAVDGEALEHFEVFGEAAARELAGAVFGCRGDAVDGGGDVGTLKPVDDGAAGQVEVLGDFFERARAVEIEGDEFVVAVAIGRGGARRVGVVRLAFLCACGVRRRDGLRGGHGRLRAACAVTRVRGAYRRGTAMQARRGDFVRMSTILRAEVDVGGDEETKFRRDGVREGRKRRSAKTGRDEVPERRRDGV